MKKSWGTVGAIGAGVLALLMGAGIWRSSLQAGETPRAIAASAPRDATPAPGETNVGANGVATPSPGGAQAEFDALMERLRKKAQTATDAAGKQALVEEIVGELQKFSAAHPGDPVSDQAQMALGQLQIRMGKAAEAIVTFRAVADHAVDPQVKLPAQFMLAQALALSGQMEVAKAKLQELSALATTGQSAEEKKVGETAKQALAQLSREDAVAVGARPPAFTAKDLSGASHSPEQYKGKVLLIDFWATWCGPCRAELPAVKAVYEKYRDQGLVVLGVNLDENKELVKRFVAAEGMTWPQLFDGKGWRNEIAQLYGVTAIPRAILIDREGTIRHAAIRGHELDAAVAELVK